jgi:Putative Ig domain
MVNSNLNLDWGYRVRHIGFLILFGVLLAPLQAQAQIKLHLSTKDNGTPPNEVGRVIVLNADDDNNDGIPDLMENPVIGETSLRRLTVSWTQNGVAVFLKKGEGGDRIRVWKDPEKRMEITFNNTDNMFVSSPQDVFVEGVKPSDKTDDVALFANFDNKDDRKGSTKLTVLWIDTWTFRSTNAQSWHADFKPTLNPRDQVVDLKDDHTGLHTYHDRLGQGIELRGRVRPSDFKPNIPMIIQRAAMYCDFYDAVNGSMLIHDSSFSTNNVLGRVEPMGKEADTCEECNQADPTKSTPAGFAYDWDNAGISNDLVKNNIYRTRKDFLQWPTYGSKRAGVFAYWSQALSAKAATDPKQKLLADLPLEATFNGRGDNKDLGTGLTLAAFKTNLSWDLNSVSCTTALGVSPAGLSNGKVGTPYGQTIISLGGFPPVTYSISAGTLPDGLTLNAAADMASANITGTPTKAGAFTFTVKATDSGTPTAGMATRVYTITIVAGPMLPGSVAQAPVGGEEPVQVQGGPTILGTLDAIMVRAQSDDGVMRTEALLELQTIVGHKAEEPEAFSRLEYNLIDSVRILAPSTDLQDRGKAFHQILMLDALQSVKSIPVLVDNLTFRNPYVTRYYRGPLSYTEPQPRDLPVFGALTDIGPESLDAVSRRAMAEDDPLVHGVLARLLKDFYGTQGALQWLDRASSQRDLSWIEIDRLNAVRELVEGHD